MIRVSFPFLGTLYSLLEQRFPNSVFPALSEAEIFYTVKSISTCCCLVDNVGLLLLFHMKDACFVVALQGPSVNQLYLRIANLFFHSYLVSQHIILWPLVCPFPKNAT
jgi:hypothetical protein